MKIKFFVLFYICFSTLSFGQNDEKIKEIKTKIQLINNEPNQTIKKLDNNYFVTKKNKSTDGGQELTGYFKGGEIRKINYSLIFSYGFLMYEYYFWNNQLIFVSEKQLVFPNKKDASGEIIGLDRTKIELVYEGSHYFENSKLIDTKKVGQLLFSDEKKNDNEIVFIEESKRLLDELNNFKN